MSKVLGKATDSVNQKADLGSFNERLDSLNSKIEKVEKLLRKFNCMGETVCSLDPPADGSKVWISWAKYQGEYRLLVTEATANESTRQPLINAKAEYRIKAAGAFEKIYDQVKAMDENRIQWVEMALTVTDDFLDRRS